MPRLRPWSPERDTAAVLAAFEASADLHRQAPPIRTLDEARDHLAAIADEALAIDVEALAIDVDVDGTAVGCAMASARHPREGAARLSYWLAPAARGRSLAARALDARARALVADGLHRLELGARANNPASIPVAGRAGCLREGVERQRLRDTDEHGRDERFDVVRLARLATDPSPDLAPLELA